MTIEKDHLDAEISGEPSKAEPAIRQELAMRKELFTTLLHVHQHEQVIVNAMGTAQAYKDFLQSAEPLGILLEAIWKLSSLRSIKDSKELISLQKHKKELSQLTDPHQKAYHFPDFLSQLLAALQTVHGRTIDLNRLTGSTETTMDVFKTMLREKEKAKHFIDQTDREADGFLFVKA